MNVSLTKFSKDNNLAKATVYRRCQELGIDTSNGLSPDAIAQLQHEFSLIAVEPETETMSTTPVTVEVGNQIVLAAPELPQIYSLEGLRTSEARGFEDPLALAAKLLQDARSIHTQMREDLEAREQRLRATQTATAALTVERQKLELEARLYQMESRKLDYALSTETERLQGEMGVFQFFGKVPNPSRKRVLAFAVGLFFGILLI